MIHIGDHFCFSLLKRNKFCHFNSLALFSEPNTKKKEKNKDIFICYAQTKVTFKMQVDYKADSPTLDTKIKRSRLTTFHTKVPTSDGYSLQEYL